MRKNKLVSVGTIWEKSKQLVSEGKLEEADDMLMRGIWRIADYTMAGHSDEYKIEGVKKSVWYERFWTLVETTGLLP
jgi:hypothetical protein